MNSIYKKICFVLLCWISSFASLVNELCYPITIFLKCFLSNWGKREVKLKLFNVLPAFRIHNSASNFQCCDSFLHFKNIKAEGSREHLKCCCKLGSHAVFCQKPIRHPLIFTVCVFFRRQMFSPELQNKKNHFSKDATKNMKWVSRTVSAPIIYKCYEGFQMLILIDVFIYHSEVYCTELTRQTAQHPLTHTFI